MNDLLHPELLQGRLARVIERERVAWASPELAELDPVRLAEQLLEAVEPYRDRIVNTAKLLNEALDAGKRVIFEGAQGCLLDLDFGTYPYVTSSNTTLGGIGTGAGVPPQRVGRIIGVVKAYTTRVGAGPFPTEERGPVGELLRERGEEFGTTTGRPRRCGWLDLVALRYAKMIDGFTELALMKLDVLSGFPEIKVGVAYRCGGQLLEDFPQDATLLAECEPVYESLPGWREEIRHMREFEELPPNARAYVRFIEEALELPVRIISVGPGWDETIFIRMGSSESEEEEIAPRRPIW